VKSNYILHGQAPIVSGSPDKGIFFTDMVADNSFWSEEGAKPNDVIKEVNGKEVTLLNANTVLQEVYAWQEGQDVHVKLLRDGKEIVIKTKAKQPYSKGSKLSVKKNATDKQNNLRNAWLKG